MGVTVGMPANQSRRAILGYPRIFPLHLHRRADFHLDARGVVAAQRAFPLPRLLAHRPCQFGQYRGTPQRRIPGEQIFVVLDIPFVRNGWQIHWLLRLHDASHSAASGHFCKIRVAPPQWLGREWQATQSPARANETTTSKTPTPPSVT